MNSDDLIKAAEDVAKEQEFDKAVKEEAESALKLIGMHAKHYLSEEGREELDEKAQRHLEALAELERVRFEAPGQVEAQQEIIGDIALGYDLCFVREKVRPEFAAYKAKAEVISFIKWTGVEFSKLAAAAAAKHLVAAVKEGLE